MVHAAGKQFSPEMQNCIDECTRCYQVCITAAGHALRTGGRESDAHHIRLLTDCAEICQTAADFMLRGSPFHKQTCAVCADICRQCAEECERSEDPVMHECARVCRSCADSCAEMAA